MRSGVGPEEVELTVFGNVVQSSPDAIYLARHIALTSGLREETPALTVNRLCGSGLQAIVSAAQSIMLGEGEVALAGGAENMSEVPHVIRGARWGIPLGQTPMADALWEALYDPYAGCSMAVTAENLAELYGISREEADAFALRSQERARSAQENGVFAKEIVPVQVKTKKSVVTVDRDEHPRQTSLQSLGALPARFKQGGLVTAGNASGINDGAAAVIMTSADYAARRRLTPLARLVSWGVVGVDPRRMGIGPVPAIQKALQNAGLTLQQMDLIEINEAFSSQFLACQRELGFALEQANVNGGAIALGHPLGASGARLALTMAYELRRRNARYGVTALCIGGGQGIAAVWEGL